jgi:leucyl/phenylalanyl-tRNA--protein transferase
VLPILYWSAVARAEVPLIGCGGALARAFSQTPASSSGAVAWGPRATVETLRAAYLNGIYPMDAMPSGRLGWFSPPRRGVLFFDQLHISRSDRKLIRRLQKRCTVVIDGRSREVIAKCQTPLVERMGNWITPRLIDGYHEAFDENLAHSIGTVDGDRLIGGLFGVYAGYFSGDSMFHDEDDAAKLALYVLIEILGAQGHTFLDVQQALRGGPDGKQSLAVKWGAQEISRAEFLELIRRAQARRLEFDPLSARASSPI